jgi:hypothetical protein
MRGLSPDERNLSTDDADYTEQNQKLETRNKKNQKLPTRFISRNTLYEFGLKHHPG